MSKWIDFVKDWAKKHNMKYSNALKDPKMKEAYHSMKGGKVADPFTTAYKAGFKLGRDVIAPALMKVIPPPKKGKGIKGGATKEQRANALLLRSRAKNNDTIQELNMIVHSADKPDEIRQWERTIGKAQGRTQIYKDYTENPTYVEDPSEPTPVDILNRGFSEFFDNLDLISTKQLVDNPHLFPADGFFIPAHFLPRWEATRRRIEKYYEELTPEDEDDEITEEQDADAFWTDPQNPITKRWSILDKEARIASTKTPEERARTKKEMKDILDKEILPAVRAYNKKWGEKDGNNPYADYDLAEINPKTKLRAIIKFPLKYGGIGFKSIEGEGMKVKHL